MINNDGGGIFSTLPQHSAHGFERIFGTPHGLDPARITASMGIPSRKIATIDQLEIEMLEPVIGLSVIVAQVPSRIANAQMITELYQSIESL